MPKGIFFVESNAEPGRDDEYNEWYNTFHLKELCAIPGIVSGRRYEVHDSAAVPAEPGKRKYVAVYEIEADDLSAPILELRARAAKGEMTRPVAIEMDPPPAMMMYELIAEAEGTA